MKTLVVAALLLAGSAAPQALKESPLLPPGQDPVLHEAKVILRTSKGELRVVLYPQVAPRHVVHFLRLVRSGFYDGTRFQWVHRGFVIQHAGPVDRLRPFTIQQEALGRVRLPVELGNLRHVRGILSMYRLEKEIESGGNIFTILLGDAPQMDGKYSIFGRVDRGFDVLEKLESVEVTAQGAPRDVLNLHRAYVEGEESSVPSDFAPPAHLLIVSGGAIAIGLMLFLLAGRLLPRTYGPIGLCAVISGFFIGFVAVTPRVLAAEDRRPALALAVFLALLALFKLMNRFESPRS